MKNQLTRLKDVGAARGPSTNPRVRVAFTCEGPSVTKQSFKDECDINMIMKKYQKTGAITHLNNRGGEYGFADAIDFREALEVVNRAQDLFDALPSSIRKMCNHDPGEFLEFVQDPKNAEELVKLGLATKRDGVPGEPKKAPG